MPLRILADLALPADAMEALLAGTRTHTLLLPARPAASVLAKGEPDPQLTTAEVVFGQPDASALLAASSVRWAQISSAGITRYDSAAFRDGARARGLMLSNSSSVYEEACAVHGLSFLLAHARQLPRGLATRTPHGSVEWNSLRATSGTLRDETLLLVGFGAIGRRLAELLRPFGVNLMAFRRRPRGDEGMPVVTEGGLAAALSQADHVVNILPESESTRLFFGEERFGQFRRGATFHNLGRGATVDQSALVAALHSGRVGAAWLDVTDPEPLPDDHPLWHAPNCFITPHVAGGHAGEAVQLVRHFLANLDRFVRGEPLLDRVF